MSNDGTRRNDHALNEGLGNELQYFVEKETCCSIITDLCAVGKPDAEKLVSDLISILDKYLEQPLLIAVHVVELLRPIYAALDSMGKEDVS